MSAWAETGCALSRVVAVHCGAGTWHAGGERFDAAKRACRSACRDALALALPPGDTVCGDAQRLEACALDACVSAVRRLESAPCANACVGGNVCARTVHVTSDASLCSAAFAQFAGVGCVPAVSSAAALCRRIVALRRRFMHDGRVPPELVVGEAALRLAAQYDCDSAEQSAVDLSVSPDKLVTEDALARWRKALQFVHSSANGESTATDGDDVMDTVGALCAVTDNCNVDMSACCSSSGPVLKVDGRVGPAAIFGAGCASRTHGGVTAAATVSGCGEYVTRTQLAQRCVDELLRDGNDEQLPLFTLVRTVDEAFVRSPHLQAGVSAPHKLAGVMALLCRAPGDCELLVAHNTPSICTAYASDARPSARVRLCTNDCPRDTVVGHAFPLL